MSVKICDECGSTETEYNEQLGEICCKMCGLVIVTEMFEETVRIVDNGVNVTSSDNGNLGSIITGVGSYKFNRWGKDSVFPKKVIEGFYHCNMVLSNVAPQMKLKARTEELYLLFLNKGLFGRTTYEARATAVVYYALLENGTQHSIKEVSEEFPDSMKSAKKLIRKIKQFAGKMKLPYNPRYRLIKTVAKIAPNDLAFRSEAENTLEYFESIIIKSGDFTKSPSYYEAICWITVNKMVHPTIQRQTISELTGVSQKTIYLETKKLLGLIGYSLAHEIKGKRLW
jgi:transcription initiation factor TFIIIB Brf1 subunit/transcription initiation factor TFIIB